MPKHKCDHSEPIWRGDQIGHYLVPFNITNKMQYWGKWIVRLWFISMVVFIILAYWINGDTAVQYLRASLLMFGACVCLWKWFTSRSKYPRGISYFAISPEEAVNELKYVENDDGSWNVSINRNSQQHIVDIEPFKTVKLLSEDRLK